MIPIHLQIKGFLSYQEPVNIDFEGFQLACITGSNGAGKSSILDAITWALFGIARSKSDAIVNQNCRSAEVDFIFRYESQIYRIQRSKTVDKSIELELFIKEDNGDRWRALTEHSVSATQEKISSILKLDYDSFVNAAFFLQGKADSFTNLNASRRKEILSNILGLDEWESYREGAMIRLRQLEMQENRISAILKEIETEIAEEENIKIQFEHLATEEQSKLVTKQNLTKLFEQAQVLEQNRKHNEQQIEMVSTELKKRMEQQQNKKEKLSELQTRLQSLNEKILQGDLIQTSFSQWKSLRQELETWDEKRDEYLKLENIRQQYEQIIAVEKSRIEAELLNLSNEASQIQINRATINDLSQEISTLQDQIEALQVKIQATSDHPVKLEEIQRDLVQNQATIKQLVLLNDELREHLKAFQNAGPECPFCSQPLTPAHREKYEVKTKTEGMERKAEIERLQIVNKALEKDIVTIKKELEQQREADKERQIYEKRKTQLQVQLNNIQKMVEDWDRIKQTQLESRQKMLAGGIFCPDEQKKLDELIPKMEAVGYDSILHQKCRVAENLLRSSESDMQALENARATYAPIQKQAAELILEIEDLQSELSEKTKFLTELRTIHQEQFHDLLDPKQIQRQLDQNQIELNQIITKIGGEKQKLATIQRRKESKTSYLSEKSELNLSISRHEKLKDAFGKNGIPALLIEQALPQIEVHANQLLDRLTNGAMSIRFETQSEYKDKKRTDKKETLEILINDLNGNTRAYEMFSGGEAFRINFAIRMALSQVLARRSGAKLQTLVIDEGFGSQDAEGRQRLIEAINQVRGDFAKILVITHLDELKDAFSTRIEVEKTAQGSQVNIQVY